MSTKEFNVGLAIYAAIAGLTALASALSIGGTVADARVWVATLTATLVAAKAKMSDGVPAQPGRPENLIAMPLLKLSPEAPAQAAGPAPVIPNPNP